MGTVPLKPKQAVLGGQHSKYFLKLHITEVESSLDYSFEGVQKNFRFHR